jgi:hypothetical protein
MIDTVERGRQVGIENPLTLGPAALESPVDRLDRVVAATSGPEPVGTRFEPRLPLRLQGIGDPGLLHPIGQHRNPERPLLAVRFRDEHPLDRPGPPRRRATVKIHRQGRPGRGGQRDLPVDARGRAASILLRHPANTMQRVRPAPQHQFLQVANLLQVPFLRRLEDPPPQPTYVVLDPTPGDLVPFPAPVMVVVVRSVHRHGVQRARTFRRCHRRFSKDSPGPRQHPLHEVPPPRWDIRPVIRARSPEETTTVLGRFPVAFQLPALASWAILFPPQMLGLPHGRPTETYVPRIGTGFPRSTCARPGRGGCRLYPEARRCPYDRSGAPDRRLPHPSGQPYTPVTIHPPEAHSDETYSGSLTFTRPAFPSPAAPGWIEDRFGFPGASHPTVTSDARPSRGRAQDTHPGYVTDTTADLQLNAPLTHATSCRTTRVVPILRTDTDDSLTGGKRLP